MKSTILTNIKTGAPETNLAKVKAKASALSLFVGSIVANAKSIREVELLLSSYESAKRDVHVSRRIAAIKCGDMVALSV